MGECVWVRVSVCETGFTTVCVDVVLLAIVLLGVIIAQHNTPTGTQSGKVAHSLCGCRGCREDGTVCMCV